MFKRIGASALFFLFPTICLANGFYVAPSIAYTGLRLSDIGWIGFTPRLALGYGGTLGEPLSWAIEIFGNPKPITKKNYPQDPFDIRPSYSWGVSLLPSLALDYELSVFVRVGVIQTRFSDFGERPLGASIGAGLGYNLTTCWCARLEYTYTRYRELDSLGKPHSDEYSLGFVYGFA